MQQKVARRVLVPVRLEELLRELVLWKELQVLPVVGSVERQGREVKEQLLAPERWPATKRCSAVDKEAAMTRVPPTTSRLAQASRRNSQRTDMARMMFGVRMMTLGVAVTIHGVAAVLVDLLAMDRHQAWVVKEGMVEEAVVAGQM